LANYVQATSEFSKELAFVDKGLSLFIEQIQRARQDKRKLEQSPSLQAARAMAISLLNYLLAARHLILLGYFPEVRSLKRDCHERLTRCLLFARDEKEARRFLGGKEIKQQNVDKKLAPYFKSDEELVDSIHSQLRAQYALQSNNVHPKLASLGLRLLPPASSPEELSSRIGKDATIGGFLSEDLGRALIVSFLGLVLQSISATTWFVREETGELEIDYKKLKDTYDSMIRQVTEDNSIAP
ncbi:MAG: hypothetical protein IIC22_03940, partial [Chloroflexi bacterium]|nr:hypothetical protein [Chloroflexota bacterium]